PETASTMETSKVKLYHVDAFTERRFGGNPAAVCLLPEARDDRWMQDVASEMNLSETAFVRRVAEDFQLRWFTPAVEVNLCCHATLAAAPVLWEIGELASNSAARFHTKSGVLTCSRKGSEIQMDFPAKPAAPSSAPDGLILALKVTPRFVGCSAFDYLVEVDA